MSVILAVTPNAAIDRTAVVDALRLDTVLRPLQVLALPGGKGINVARAARRLGATIATTGFAGGHAGRWLLEHLKAEGLQPQFVEIAGETRTTYTTTDTQRAVIVFEDGPEIDQADAGRLVDLLDASLRGPDRPLVALSGSMPRGEVAGLAARLVERCRARRATIIVDTSGAALVEAVAACPDIVKVNAHEAVEAGYGAALPTPSSWSGTAMDLARSLAGGGAGTAIVTAGAQGAVAVDGDRAWVVEAPPIEVVSAVGSGDAFTAGLAVGIERGLPLEACLVEAAAAGAANAAKAGAGVFDLEHQRRLAAMTQVTVV